MPGFARSLRPARGPGQGWLAAAAVAAGLVLAGPVPAHAQADDEYMGLPEDEGREEVAIYCSACHSLRLVIQQRLPRHRWEELLVWMNEKQGMERLEPDEERLVIDYLSKHLAPRPRKRRF